MTTARDVIARALQSFELDAPPEPWAFQEADHLLRALLSAPESVRLELAGFQREGGMMAALRMSEARAATPEQLLALAKNCREQSALLLVHARGYEKRAKELKGEAPALPTQETEEG